MSHTDTYTTWNIVSFVFWVLLIVLSFYLFFQYRELRRHAPHRPITWRFQLLHILAALFMPFVELIVLWAGFDDLEEERHMRAR
jgi:heme/copper-type cytochrome/quinol oxidase subunit 2